MMDGASRRVLREAGKSPGSMSIDSIAWVDVNIFVIMKWRYLTLEERGSPGALTLMFKVTPPSGTRPHIGSPF